MRFGVVAAVASAVVASSATPAVADPGWLELGGFAGGDALPGDIQLGNSTKPEQRPETSLEVGARLTWVALPTDLLELALEAELGVTTSWTGYGFDTGRDSYFAPVFAYRGAIALRLAASERVKPFVLVGAGGQTVVTSSPYMTDATAAQFFYGAGAALDIGGGLQLRFDGRQGLVPTENGGVGATYELTVAIGGVFGRPAKYAPKEDPVERAEAIVVAPPAPPVPLVSPVTPPPVVVPPPPPPVVVVQPPPSPPPPTDPTLDSDKDGIPDIRDTCPHDPETKNGFEDEDGCPDVIPPEIASAFTGATAVRFEPRRVRLTEAAKAAFDEPAAVLRAHPHLHVNVVAHAGDGDPDGDLARKRAFVVKWHLVEEGVPADQIDVIDGDPQPGGDGPPIELVLAPKPPKPPPSQ